MLDKQTTLMTQHIHLQNDVPTLVTYNLPAQHLPSVYFQDNRIEMQFRRLIHQPLRLCSRNSQQRKIERSKMFGVVKRVSRIVKVTSTKNESNNQEILLITSAYY